MDLIDITFKGPTITKVELLSILPWEYSNILQQVNGFIQFHGGLHIRGICTVPLWHSLEEVWNGEHALHKLFPAISQTDIPFGQDALGDQYILREETVYHLEAETGTLSNVRVSFTTFLERAQQNPLEYLKLQPMLQFYNEGGKLELGELIDVYPPFITQEAGTGISLRAVPVFDRIQYLAALAQHVKQFPDGARIQLPPCSKE